MKKLYIKDIKVIEKNKKDGGYDIIFYDNQVIRIHKRRTIPALLTLIKYGEGCESDLTNATDNLISLKTELAGKIPDNLIQNSYADANKPFSELWNEEGFVFIKNPAGEKRLGSQKYVLEIRDHKNLFTATKKAKRKPPNKITIDKVLEEQKQLCNLCGSRLKAAKDIAHNTYAKDRVRLVWDHRVPVEKGGDSGQNNYQALCFYCNKCKWQICNICTLSKDKCLSCALGYIENGSVIAPTGENIKDRVTKRK